MHQNAFAAGLYPGPRCVGLDRSPNPLTGFKGAALWQDGTWEEERKGEETGEDENGGEKRWGGTRMRWVKCE